MSKQVLDVQQMQHLQKLGLKLKPSLVHYYKINNIDSDKWYLSLTTGDISHDSSTYRYIPAYTLQDVLDALPKYYHIANIGWTKLSIRVHSTKEWEVGYVYTDTVEKYAYGCRKTSKELIDAAYELLIWCIENKFVETNKNE